MGIVRKLNILEEAQTFFAVIQFDVACPLSCKLAWTDYTFLHRENKD
jgi:hypothetical protein